MNYRHKLLQQQIKNNYVPKDFHLKETQELKKARAQDLIDQLQKDLGIDFLLDYSEIVKKLKGRTVGEVIEQLAEQEQKTKEKQQLLDNTVNLLGSEDIKNLTDITNLLKGKSLKELVDYSNSFQQKIKDLETQLINLAKQKIKGQKEAEKLLSELETKWSKKEIE